MTDPVEDRVVRVADAPNRVFTVPIGPRAGWEDLDRGPEGLLKKPHRGFHAAWSAHRS